MNTSKRVKFTIVYSQITEYSSFGHEQIIACKSGLPHFSPIVDTNRTRHITGSGVITYFQKRNNIKVTAKINENFVYPQK